MSKATLASPEQAPEQAPKQSFWRTLLKKYIRPAVVLTLLLTVLTGLIYPGVVTALAQLIFPYQANGSLHYVNGKLVGSDLIGQYWTSSKYFHGRPSATVSATTGKPEPYAADNSTASNLGPTNATLVKDVQQRVAELKKENPNAPPGPVPGHPPPPLPLLGLSKPAREQTTTSASAAGCASTWPRRPVRARPIPCSRKGIAARAGAATWWWAMWRRMAAPRRRRSWGIWRWFRARK